MASYRALPLWFVIFNALVFQAIWFLAILFGDSLFLLAVVGLVGVHFFSFWRVLKSDFLWRNELMLLTLCLVVGFVVETLKLKLGVWSPLILDLAPPVWLLAIWIGFGLSLHVSLKFLQSSVWLPLVMGGLIAPLSYYAGAKLSPTYELAGASSLFIIATIWAFIMPLLIYLAKRLPASEASNA